jgi:hypothetical protein
VEAREARATLKLARSRSPVVFKDGVGFDSRKLIDSARGLVGLR